MNLMVRTWAIWRGNRSVCLLLALVTLGHWFTLTLDSKDTQVSSSSSFCGFLVVNPTYSAATSTYTMIFDLLLLILTMLGLSRSSSSSLWTTLRSQGIIYFFITFLASVIPLIFSWLNFNYIMNIFFAYPAACVMTMASSRAVIPTFNTPH
ncbi:uncharacterized protein EDB91DRAFT_1166186, partial [Suillus paluster]|uniref:uncharacterized protein n=1 Tax=Suillus paluster TaxID=48578 RepID=UPI001B864567